MSDVAAWLARLAATSRDVRSEAVGWARDIKPARKDRVAIVTDTSAALPDEVYQLPNGSGLFIIPIPAMIRDQIYNEEDEDLQHAHRIEWAARTSLAT